MGLQPLDTTPVSRLLRSSALSSVLPVAGPFGSWLSCAPIWVRACTNVTTCDQATLEESEGRKAAAILKIQIEIICTFQPVIPVIPH
jgi:hypothetical protein